MAEQTRDIAELLALDSYQVDETPHIRVDTTICVTCTTRPCLRICSAGCFREAPATPDGSAGSDGATPGGQTGSDGAAPGGQAGSDGAAPAAAPGPEGAAASAGAGSRGAISFDHAGCLECGTCRIVCRALGRGAVVEWSYPEATYGIGYRYG